MDTERVTRGDLPHWYRPGHAHFVTYRLADSIPQAQLARWKEERQRLISQPPPAGFTVGEARERAHKLFYKHYDEYLDRNPGARWLQQDVIAEIVRESLYHHHGKQYELLAWCVMPNHVHILIQPLESGLCGSTPVATDAGSVSHVKNAGHVADAASIRSEVQSDEIAGRSSVLSRIMHRLKSYTANRANEVLSRQGRFWQRESYDHWVRDIDELEKIVDYIRFNPVTAGLCREPQQWRFSSAYDRYQQDGSECGLVGWLRDDWRR